MKRIAFFLELAVAFFIALAVFKPAHAQTIPSYKLDTGPSFGEAVVTPDMNSQTSYFSGVGSIAYTLTCFGIGYACSPATGNPTGYIQRSAVGQLGNVIAMTYSNEPADLGLWIADTGQSLGFIPKQAYAQGIGFSGLSPLLPVWKAFRNIAYLLMAVVMIVIGFLIMFRQKIDPKTVVTAQNAIPRVIMALILITFSYAIVGLLIDLMYVLLFFAIQLFKPMLPAIDPNSMASWLYQYKTPEALYGQGALPAVFSTIPVDPFKIFGINNPVATGTTITSIITALVGFLAVVPTAPIGGGAIGVLGAAFPLVWLILTVALIFLFIRLAAFFVGAYIQIIISLLFAPLQLLMESLPGSDAFGSWIRNLVANLAVFPVAAIMFMLAAVFINFSNGGTTLFDNRTIWVPPYTAFFSNMTAISTLVALGLAFAIPGVCGQVKEALKAKPAVPMMDMGGAGGSVMNLLSTAYYFKMLAPGDFWKKLTGGKGGPEEHH